MYDALLADVGQENIKALSYSLVLGAGECYPENAQLLV